MTASLCERPGTVAGPDLSLLRLIHRADGGYIGFASKRNGNFRNLFAVPVAELDANAAAIAEHLDADAFYTINTMREAGQAPSRYVATLPSAQRSRALVRSLNAVFVDLDLHERGLDPEDVLERVHARTAAGHLPTPSILVHSGRGLWLMWLLQDELTGLPPTATQQTLILYDQLQRAVNRLLSDLGADCNAKDAARLTRIPGSLNSKSDQPVRYALAQGRVPAYGLADLAQAFAVPSQPSPRSLPTPASSKTIRTGRGCWDVYPSRVRQLEKLWEIRGGFREGCRQNAAFLYANFLHRSGVGREDLTRKVDQLADACHPPLPRKECRGAVKSALNPKARKLRNQTISDWLDITPEEAEQLETWPPASRFGKAEEPPPRRQEKLRTRRQLILQLIQNLGGVLPAVREMTRLLADYGHRVSVATVHRDYVALGLAQAREPPEGGGEGF